MIDTGIATNDRENINRRGGVLPELVGRDDAIEPSRLLLRSDHGNLFAEMVATSMGSSRKRS
jgi:hypothetical protein